MYGRRDVFRVGGVIVKSTVSWTILQEAEDLVFLNNNSQVRVPILYAAFSRSDNERPEDRRYYMVMEDIQGVELSTELWLSFGIETRKKICSKLAEQLRLLRETPPPAPAYYGRVHNQGWEPDLGLFRTRSQDLLGPYESYSDFCKAFLRTARFNAARCYRKLENDPVLLLLLSDLETNVELWNGNQPTFTHIDPAFGNMIIQQVRKSSDGDEDWEVALIDWANAGWYPRWMQAVALNESLAVSGVINGKFKIFPKERKEFIELISETWEESYDKQVNMFDRLRNTLEYWVH